MSNMTTSNPEDVWISMFSDKADQWRELVLMSGNDYSTPSYAVVIMGWYLKESGNMCNEAGYFS